jgi:hypothetical protein
MWSFWMEFQEFFTSISCQSPMARNSGYFLFPMEQNAGFSVTSAAPPRVHIVDLTDIIAN